MASSSSSLYLGVSGNHRKSHSDSSDRLRSCPDFQAHHRHNVEYRHTTVPLLDSNDGANDIDGARGEADTRGLSSSSLGWQDHGDATTSGSYGILGAQGSDRSRRFISHSRHRSSNLSLDVRSADACISSFGYELLEERSLESPKTDGAKRRMYGEEASSFSLAGALASVARRLMQSASSAGRLPYARLSESGSVGGTAPVSSATSNAFGHHSHHVGISRGPMMSTRTNHCKEHRLDVPFLMFASVLYSLFFYLVFFVDTFELVGRIRTLRPHSRSFQSVCDP